MNPTLKTVSNYTINTLIYKSDYKEFFSLVLVSENCFATCKSTAHLAFCFYLDFYFLAFMA
jgi:hypothetical protein